MLRLVAAARRHGVAAPDRWIGWKYLGEYLAQNLSTANRAKLIAAHYSFLFRHVPNDAGRRAWTRGVVLWERKVGLGDYVIRLSPSSFSAMEGEMQLSFHRADQLLFTLTFALIDGSALSLPCDHALFIGGMQGGIACRHEQRAAARNLGEIAPAAMLVIAARVVAQALGLSHIIAVSSDRQTAFRYADDQIRFSYDDYWGQHDAHRLAAGYFLLSANPAQRNLDHLSPAHRARTRRKILLKAEFAAEMLRSLQASLTASGEPAHPG